MTPPSIAACLAVCLLLSPELGLSARAQTPATGPTSASLRALRESGRAGWRREALAQLDRRPRGVNHSSETDSEGRALLQEAVFVLGTPELFREAWKPASGSVSAIVDFEGNRSLELDESGVLSIRDLSTDAVQLTKPARRVADRQLVRYHPATGWIALVDRQNRWGFRSLKDGPEDFIGDPVPSNAQSWVSFHPEVQRIATPSVMANASGLALSPLPPRDPSGIRHIVLPAIAERFEFSPSGTRLAAVAPGNSGVWILQPALDRVEERIPLGFQPVDLSWMPDARRVVLASTNAVWVMDAQEGSLHAIAENLPGIAALALNESGSVLAIARHAGRIELWDFKAARPLLEIEVAGSPIQRMQWDPKSARIAVTLAGDPFPRILGVSMSRDVVRYVPRGETPLPDSDETSHLRRHGDRVWIRRELSGEIELPTPKHLKAAAVSPNGAWVQLRAEDGAITEWNLPRLRERLQRWGLAW